MHILNTYRQNSRFDLAACVHGLLWADKDIALLAGILLIIISDVQRLVSMIGDKEVT